GAKWFSISGVINAFGILSINYAICLGGVVLAAPLAATAPIWALLFGFLMCKNEKLCLQQFIVALFVVLGSVLIVVR
ncbi:MAG: EamA family transporter, partial [Rhodobacteraceae bacterium]|nr:EamA family transporter [Paracoccaceae bacterium]